MTVPITHAADASIAPITALHPDVSLVDVQMPGGSGLDVLRGITDSGTRTIMLTAFDLDEYVAGALEWGASGFLLKNASSSDVLSAVRAVHAGHASLAPEITARLMSQFAQPSQPRHPFADVRLSARELQITRRSPTSSSSRCPLCVPICAGCS